MGITIINHREPKTGVAYDLLWENASPSSTFAAQTVSLNLSAYTAIKITYTSSNTSSFSGILITELAIGADTVLNGIYYYFTVRGVTVAVDGVAFAEGKRFESAYGSSTVSSYANGCVPLKIWGIR